MSKNLNEAVALLNDLIALARVTTSVVDQARLDAVVDGLALSALEDVERFSDVLEAGVEAAAEAAAEADAEAARNVIREAERDAQALVQEEEDQAERDERHGAGVS